MQRKVQLRDGYHGIPLYNFEEAMHWKHKYTNDQTNYKKKTQKRDKYKLIEIKTFFKLLQVQLDVDFGSLIRISQFTLEITSTKQTILKINHQIAFKK